MSSFHFDVILPAIISPKDHDKIYKRELEKRARRIALAASDVESDNKTLGISNINDGWFGSKGTKEAEVPIESLAKAKEDAGIDSEGGSRAATDGVAETSHAVSKSTSVDKPEAKKVAASSSNSAVWHKRIRRNEKYLQKLKEAIKQKEASRSKRSKTFRPGRRVTCRRKKVSTVLPRGRPSDGIRNSRKKLLGTIIQQSPLDERTWLIKFDENCSWYCHDTALVLEGGEATSDHLSILTDKELEMMRKSRHALLAQDHEDLLKPILFPVIAFVPSNHVVSIENIVKKLKPKYSWLTVESLRDYINEFQRNLTDNKYYRDSSVISNTASVPTKSNNDDDECSSTFSSDLEDLFKIERKKPQGTDRDCSFSSTENKEDGESSSSKKYDKDNFVVCTIRKKSYWAQKYIAKKYPDTSSSEDENDRLSKPVATKDEYDDIPPKVEKYLSSAKRSLNFDKEGMEKSNDEISKSKYRQYINIYCYKCKDIHISFYLLTKCRIFKQKNKRPTMILQLLT